MGIWVIYWGKVEVVVECDEINMVYNVNVIKDVVLLVLGLIFKDVVKY